jgi:hypothetical protein
MIAHRESFVFDSECKFCARDSRNYVPDLNTRICPDCFSWISAVAGLSAFGIRQIQDDPVENLERNEKLRQKLASLQYA